MQADQLLQYAVSALGACIMAIGWWIGLELRMLSEKMERVLIQIESHDRRIEILETKEDLNA